MRGFLQSLAFPLVFGSLAACATGPALTRHVDPAPMARLDPAVVRPTEEAHEKALADLEHDSTRAHERVNKAEAGLRTGAEAQVGDEKVKQARLERARAELRWQSALVDGLVWRRAV